MFKKKNHPEKAHLLADTLSSNSGERNPKQDGGGVEGVVKHCHDNSRAQEDRERERKVARKRLYVVSVVCLLFMVGEILGGYFAGSLAVMTDAAHLLVDLTSFLIKILGALLSVFTIWLVTGVLVYLAVERIISDDYTIDGTIMLITSGCAVLANIIMALTLHQSGHGHSHGGLSSHGHNHGNDKGGHAHDTGGHAHDTGGHAHDTGGHAHDTGGHAHDTGGHAHIDGDAEGAQRGARVQQANASVRAAFVHVVGDLLQSVSVLVSALIIYFKPEYKIADPICTFLFSVFVLGTTATILRDILLVLMEGTPAGVRYVEVRERLLAVKGVTAVHNLHIWALTMNQAVLSAHVAIDVTVDAQSVLREMTQACYHAYNFHSITIQMEREADLKPDCTLCEDPVV
ncbi:hypothetical protein NHX12_024011 [Muraenolepis orangiensis]|uniref:Proton-coupled zinc antiporter SLC30A8 n=1 Tax=Muraenolepis orangiensis TaxID=630683 RepID=A0A9Q0IT87_9TELE|nr:hypothetical protein NHX12_024011 [Muraenolepis orangiensis]